MDRLPEKSILLGNGFNINFGGRAYTNQFIIKRIIFNARAGKYDTLFEGTISGEEIAQLFISLADWTNDITAGKYDTIIKDEDSAILDDFKSRYNWKLEHYYEVGLEDWFFILHVYFLENDDLKDDWASAKVGFERMMLDAIYNDGDIQNLYKTMSSPVKRWLGQYKNIFTLNYDNNVEELTKKPVLHLHGDYRTPSNSENPNTVQGYIRAQAGQSVVIPQFEHCYCNALFDYAGEHKYEIASAFEKGEQGLVALEQSGVLPNFFPAPISEMLRVHLEHPELSFGVHYHFEEFRNLSGELHIVGMSPNNDAHIFRLIDESKINKVIFYYHSPKEADHPLPVHQKVEYRKSTDLWRELRSLPKQYNCNYAIPNSPEVDKFIDVFNRLSSDPVTKAEVLEGVNALPKFKVDELCEMVAQRISDLAKAGRPENGDELLRQFREVSRIALRNGVLPSALYCHVIMSKKMTRKSKALDGE